MAKPRLAGCFLLGLLRSHLWSCGREGGGDPRAARGAALPLLCLLGQFLTLEEVRALVKPSALALGTVHKWLEAYGVRDCQAVHTEDFLQCQMPAK